MFFFFKKISPLLVACNVGLPVLAKIRDFDKKVKDFTSPKDSNPVALKRNPLS